MFLRHRNLGTPETSVLGTQEPCFLGVQEPCILAMSEFLKSPNPGFADLVGLKMVFGLQMDISEDSGEDPGFKHTSFSRRSLS